MRVRALVPLNHKGKTVVIDQIIELEDEAAVKKLIEVKAVEEVKNPITLVEADAKIVKNK